MPAHAEPLSLRLRSGQTVSALVLRPPKPRGCLVLAHGAGAGMHHPFMASLAEALSGRGIATLRFQFPFMESGGKRPDRADVAQEAVREAVAEAARHFPALPLFAGGKSFGGRMASQAQAERPMPGVAGLVFVGFPLHPAGKPGTERAVHLRDVRTPMLFLQGDRDALADIALLQATTASLGDAATLHVVTGADHAFHVPARSGRTQSEVMQELADRMAHWMGSIDLPQR
ncbi:alpha/beta family hydrolase [Ramlibacter sp. AN1015]|uniref:alpha/beta hydrolase family protein n=1 Tax=Ramlibacter sp. AN1015 TaxID=3133428 RepID=UPI0030BC858D